MAIDPKVRDLVPELDDYQCKLRFDCCMVTATTVYRFPNGADEDDITHLMAVCVPCLRAAVASAGTDPPPNPGTRW